MYFIDTNIFLRTLIKEDKKTFQDSCALLEAIKTNKIKGVTAGIVLTEVIWTLSSFHQLSKKESLRAVRSILNLRGLRVSDHYRHQDALAIYESHQVKYVDALIASIEEVGGQQWTVISYDRDFDKLDVTRKEPAEILKSLE